MDGCECEGIPNVVHGASEGDGGELGTARSISETSSTAPCTTFVDPISSFLMTAVDRW